MSPPRTFGAFWNTWAPVKNCGGVPALRPLFAEVATVFEAVGAFNERQRLIAAGWIEPKAVIPHRPCTPSPDHPAEYVTGLNIPETPA